MKYKKTIIILIIGMILGIFIEKIIFFNSNNNVKISNSKKQNAISMMLEIKPNSENYELTTRNEWPTSDYKFNSKLSKCENGGVVSWDYKSNNVIMEGTTSDKCYIYFDKVVTVDMYCNNGDNLADCIKTFGNEGYDKSSIYIHDESLKNGASDNSYRFAGSSNYVNNYVCFGSNEEVCSSDNLYRIIGVFGDNVKLIKADYANNNLLGTDGAYNSSSFSSSDYSNYQGSLTNIHTYSWNNSTNTNVWSESNLNTINLNKNYLNNLGESWANMIAESSWKVGGNTYAKTETSPMYEIYQNEIVSPAESTTYSAKIGLMYVSDYGYAANQKYWLYLGFDKNHINDYIQAINENWLYMGILEWTITRNTDSNVYVYRISYAGDINSYSSFHNYAIRPCFYLNSTVTYNGGKGTKEEPILLKLN